MNNEVYYKGPRSIAALPDLDHITRGVVAVDIETVSLENRDPIGIGFAPNPHESFYFPIESDLLPWHILENPSVVQIYHNGHFDLQVLKSIFGLDVTTKGVVWDTLIAAQLLGFPPALNTIAKLLFNVDLPSIKDLIGTGKSQLDMTEVPVEIVADKCHNDTIYSYKIWEAVSPSVPWEPFQLEMDIMPVLMRMQEMGMRVDVEKLEQHRVEVKKNFDYYKMIANGMGFNPGSSKQVAAVLEDRGWTVGYNRKTGNPKLGEEELSTLYKEDPISHLVLAYRKSQVLLRTFIDAILEKHLDGDRIYPNVNQALVVSGRLSRTNPNTQNIPFDMRNIFIPSKGNEFEDWDLSQIELRILAYLVFQNTGDYTMQRVYDNDGNIHQETTNAINTATGLNIAYKVGKECNFATVYRGTPRTLYQKMGIPEELGEKFQAAMKVKYPGIEQYFQQVCRDLHLNGYTETMMGRKRYFPDAEDSRHWVREKCEREGFNHIIQGSAGEIMKKLQVRTGHGPQCNQIHDEVIFDLPFGVEMNRDACLNLAPFRTPMEMKRGMNWRDMKETGKHG